MALWGMWLILGLALLVIEVTAPAFVSIFFGLSALLVALLCGLAGKDFPVWVSWILFVGLAVVLLITLRGFCTRLFGGKRTPDADLASDIVGQRAVVTMRIQPGQPGKIELRGANWQAVAGETLEPGAQVRVVKQESITLTVERL